LSWVTKNTFADYEHECGAGEEVEVEVAGSG
jgi:hypothetical protein